MRPPQQIHGEEDDNTGTNRHLQQQEKHTIFIIALH